MEQELNQNTAIYIDAETKANFFAIAKWSKFLSIMGFIGMGIMLIAGVGMIIAGFKFATYMPAGVMNFGVLGLIYIVIAGIYFVPFYYFFKSAVDIKNGLFSNNQLLFSSGIAYLKSHLKFMGIMTIIILSLYVLIIIGAIIVAMIAL
ncbi:MAG: hypothetical protein V4667_02580 [Bacteroidota bacterium]